MAYASTTEMNAPMGEMNTTPLIDVMLVLLIMFIITIPVATHEVEIPLPIPGLPPEVPPVRLDQNKIVIDAESQLFWNGQSVNQAQVLALLSDTQLLPIEPELQFEPTANASYESAAKTLAIIKSSGVTKFGFVGNEKFRSLTE